MSINTKGGMNIKVIFRVMKQPFIYFKKTSKRAVYPLRTILKTCFFTLTPISNREIGCPDVLEMPFFKFMLSEIPLTYSAT